MILRDELIHYLHGEVFGEELMAKALAKDEVANGVQFHGAEEVEKVALGVTCNEAFLQKAAQWGAQVCLFHHGFDGRTYKSQYLPNTQRQLRLIIENNLTVSGYHYALDAHEEIGNNATIIRELGGEIVDTLYEEWGFVGKLSEPQPLSELKERCKRFFDHEVMHFGSGRDRAQIIGVVSGAGKPYHEHVVEMMQKGVELYISGETSESNPHRMMESGIDYFVCGHYATEAIGIKEVGKKIAEKFGDKVVVKFVDVTNPI